MAQTQGSTSGFSSADLLVPLAPTVRGSQVVLVLEWGATVGASAFAAGIGVPTDLDVYLKFSVSDTEECLVYYNSPRCGGATLVRSDSLAAPEADDYGPGDAAATNGVETIVLSPMLATSYSLWVRNSALDQPLMTSGLRAHLYSSAGLLGQVTQPAPCGNATRFANVEAAAAVAADDYADDYAASLSARGVRCPYHDTPLDDDGSASPFWGSAANIEASE